MSCPKYEFEIVRMNIVAANIIRMSGLLIEMIGVWAVFRGSGDTDALRISLPGGSTVPVSWLAVGLGFALWLIGTVMVTVSRSPRRKARRTADEIDWPGIDDELSKPERIDDGSA